MSTDLPGALGERVFDLISAGDAESLRELLNAHPSLAEARREDGVSAVLWARYSFEFEALDALLAADPRLDAFEAAAIGRMDVLQRELAANGELAVAFSPDGFTALGLASFFGHPEAVQLLLAHGARVNDASQNAMRVTPLHSSLAGGDAQITEILLEAGADPNVVQADGYTPLHEAAQNGDQTLARRLVAAGANPAARLDDGSTPAESARKAGHTALADWLETLPGVDPGVSPR